MSATRAIFTPLRVGLVVLLGIAAFFVMLSFLSKQKYNDKETYRVIATFKDASGLGPKSRVQIAGLEVGIVDHIDLTDDAKARAVLLIRNSVRLKTDCRITKRSASLLGDYLLDVYPGTPEAPEMKEGEEIGTVIGATGVEDVFAALGEVTRDIQKVTRSLASLLASDEVGSIKEIIKSVNDVAQSLNRTVSQAGGRLDSILGDVQELSASLKGFSSGQEGNIEAIIGSFRQFASQANKVLAAIEAIVGTSQGDLHDSVASVKDTVDQLRTTLESGDKLIGEVQGTVHEATSLLSRVDNGEGTFGKLVRDDGIAMKIDKLLFDVNTILAPVTELQTWVNLREEIHFLNAGRPSGKAALELRLIPRPDKFYAFEILSDPRGKTSLYTVAKTPPGATEVTEQRIETTTSDVKYSGYIGKRYGPVALKLGVIESTGGFGADFYALNDKLRVTVDAFDFANSLGTLPRLRTSVHWTVFDRIYLGIGVDDVLNQTAVLHSDKTLRSGFDAYVTGGLQFNDEDLKSLLTVVGMPKLP